MSFISGIVNYYNQGAVQSAAFNAASQTLEYAKIILEWPNSICDQTSDFLAFKTVSAISYASPLIPSFIKNRYHKMCSDQADRCVTQVETLLVEFLKIQKLASQAQALPHVKKKLYETAHFLLVKVLECLTFLGKYTQAFKKLEADIELLLKKNFHESFIDQGLQSVADSIGAAVSSFHADQKNKIKEQLIVPLIQSIHKKSAEVVVNQAFSLSYNLAIRAYFEQNFANQIPSLVQMHGDAVDVTWYAEKGLQAAVWTPVIYRCGSIGWAAYNSWNRAKKIEQVLATWKPQSEQVAKQMGLPAASAETLLKIASLLMAEVPFFVIDQLSYKGDQVLLDIGNSLVALLKPTSLRM